MAKPYKKADGGGLFILVNPDGKRLWRFSYRVCGKQKTLAIGIYPIIGLAAARKVRAAAKQQPANGIDPSEARKREKQAVRLARENGASLQGWTATSRSGGFQPIR